MVKIESELQMYKDEIILMATQVRKMYTTALSILVSGDKIKALSIIELDEYVNNANENINDKAIEVLSLLSPVASDLRIILAGIKIATDLERIGDYAKNIGRFIIKNDKLDPSLLKFVNPLGDQFLQFFDASIQAYKDSDVKAALSIPAHDEKIDAMFKELLNFLSVSEKSHSLDIAKIIPTVGMLRNIERAGDHTKNICEHVIYEVKGQHYDFG